MVKKTSRKRKISRQPAVKKLRNNIRNLIKKGKTTARMIIAEQKAKLATTTAALARDIDKTFSQVSDIPRVMIVAGSKSDVSLMQEVQKVLNDYGVESNIHIASAHRSPELVRTIAGQAEKEYELIIAGAGLAAALPGALAAHTVLPVIGLPVKTEALNGLDALVSIMQMPPGVPVATVAINGAKNAALLAVQILSLKYPALREQFRRYKKTLAAPPTDVQLA